MTTTSLTCREVADFLMAYLDHELDAEQRAAFEAHLCGCDDCVAYLRRYEQTIRLSKAAFRDPAAPADVPERLVQAILAARRR